MSSKLIQMLDSMSNERPEMMRMKKRHLNRDFDEATCIEPLKETLHWMRINAERERISRFRQIA